MYNSLVAEALCSGVGVFRRSASAESGRAGGRGSQPDLSYQSLPRRLSSQARQPRIDRRQSFQDFKTFRDKFTGKLDFKTTLRTSVDQKREEPRREVGRETGRKGRHYSEPRDYHAGQQRRGGYLIESDFDFRSPPSTRDSSRERRGRQEETSSSEVSQPRRGHVEKIYASPRTYEGKRYQYGYHDLKQQLQAGQEPRSPEPEPPGRGADPLSPRRVEFADEVFSFKTSLTPGTSRPGSRCESPNPKGILRHTNSDPSAVRGSAGRSIAAVLPLSPTSPVRSHTTDLSFVRDRAALTRPTTLLIPPAEPAQPAHLTRNTQPLVKIMVQEDLNDSDDTLIEEKHETESSKESSSTKRQIPPPLADWNRSQSFPPARKKSEACESGTGALGERSHPVSSSSTSILSGQVAHSECSEDLDLIRNSNECLRVRVGDLEQQVHDNNDEIKCLKATLAECLRRVDEIEARGGAVRGGSARRRTDPADSKLAQRRPHSQDFIGRATFDLVPAQRGSYAPRQR